MGRPISSLERECDTPEKALGAVITELRVKRKWSYQDVAHKVGCNDAHLNKIEHGKQNPTVKTLRAIADTLHIKLSKLFALAERKYERCLKKKRAAEARSKAKPS